MQLSDPVKTAPMRVASPGHLAFAATMIGLGVLGLIQRNFTPVWDPVPQGAPAREVLVYLAAFLSLGCGAGLLIRRTSALAARVLFVSLLLWMLLFRLPFFRFDLGTGFPVFTIAVMVAAAWVLYSWFASDWDRQRLGFLTGAVALRIARVLYALAMIFFGAAHFLAVPNTVSLIPGWLPWHVFWAYFFGCAFVAAGVGILLGVYARLAAALSAVEIGLFTLLVWVPIMAAGSTNAFQRSETVLSWALTAGAWVVADSYRATPWLMRNAHPPGRGGLQCTASFKASEEPGIF